VRRNFIMPRDRSLEATSKTTLAVWFEFMIQFILSGTYHGTTVKVRSFPSPPSRPCASVPCPDLLRCKVAFCSIVTHWPPLDR
jgi:hypothetical protein